jgi:hypothetical protein
MNNLTKNTETQTSHSEACAQIRAIVLESINTFTPEKIENLVRSIYGANSLLASKDAVLKKITHAIEQVIIAHSAESRLFRKVGNPFTCWIPSEYIELTENKKPTDSLVVGGEYLVTFLEIKAGEVSYSEAVDFLEKTNALFPGANFLHYLNQFHTDKISTFRRLYILDREPSTTMHQLFDGKVSEIATAHGVCDSDILVLITKI